MKRTLWILGLIAAAAMTIVSCKKDYAPEEPATDSNSIVLNPYKQWTTSRIPAYIGDISAMPSELQDVIRHRFPRLVSPEAAGIIFVGANELNANGGSLAAAAKAGAFIVVPGNANLSPLGAGSVATPEVPSGLAPLFVCYNGWKSGQYYVMYDEAVLLQASQGTPSMNAEEWKELSRVNRTLGDDGGISLTDYDNDPDHNENYFQARIDPFVEWIDATYFENRGVSLGSADYDYDDFKASIEQSGQRLTYNYPFTLNEYIDQASLSDADYLCKSGSITVDFRIFPIYMLSSNGDKAGDYYGVVSTVTPHNQSMWGPYAASHGWCRNRIYGFWFADMDVATSLLNSDGSAIPGLEYFERPLPENKNDSKTYSNGHTVSIQGSFSGGRSGGSAYAVGQFAVGGSWTSSTNYTLETINYSLDSSSPTVKYHYWSENVKLTDDWDDWTIINQNFPAPVRTEFSSHTMWVWHVPGEDVKDNDTRQFRLKTQIKLRYSSWYHWRGAVEYDSNRKWHNVPIPELQWLLDRPDRTPWGFIRLRNATSNEMAHVAFYKQGQTGGDPVARLTTSYGKGDEARIALPEGIYDVTWDIVDGDTGARLGSWIYRNVEVRQGRDESSATIRISTVDGEPVS
ncbi:MAG: hypothetical protein J6Y27_03810 [Bacteroidales bacterium]|nr:hypothetical protein [Bacteroidales bacterium]MBP5389454.1 hypothetical protein [Bacteroidales bacterium]